MPTSVSLKIPPLLGQSSQEGSSIPALQASQNHGADWHKESVLEKLSTSDTP